MRILHLLDEADAYAAMALLPDLAHAAAADAINDHHALLIGRQQTLDAARALGLSGAQRVRAPRHRPLLALPALHAAIKKRGEPDVIHTWTPDADRAARLIRRATPRVHGACGTPWVDEQHVDGSRRQSLRERWGVSPETWVVAVTAQRVDQTPAMDAALGVGMARECLEDDEPGRPPRPRLLLHPAAAGLPKMMAVTREMGWSDAVIQDASVGRPWRCFPAVDAVVALGGGGGGGGAAALWAAACEAPIITQRGGAVGDGLIAAGGALPVDPGLPLQVAAQLLKLFREPPARVALVRAARAAVDARFTRDEAARSLAACYLDALAGAAAPALH